MRILITDFAKNQQKIAIYVLRQNSDDERCLQKAKNQVN